MSKNPQFIKVLSSFPRTVPKRRKQKPPTQLRKVVAAQQFALRLIKEATRDNYACVFKSERSFCLSCEQAFTTDFILETHLYFDYEEPDYDSVRCPICDKKALITPFHVQPKQMRLISTLVYVWKNRLLSLYKHY